MAKGDLKNLVRKGLIEALGGEEEATVKTTSAREAMRKTSEDVLRSVLEEKAAEDSKVSPKKGTGNFIEEQAKAMADAIREKVGKKQGFRGMYCTKCDSVWEMKKAAGETTKEVKHPGFPSYGLYRQDCSECCERKI